MTRKLVLLPLILLAASFAHAQAGPGYVKLGATNGTSLIDSAVTDGAVYLYQVTAYNAEGVESTPLTSNPAAIPSTSTHTVSLAWIASTAVSVAGYNVYRIMVPPPSPPLPPAAGNIATVN